MTDTRKFPSEFTQVTPATDDDIILGDTSDSGNVKKAPVSDVVQQGMAGNTTDDLPEGSTNLYYTNDRIRFTYEAKSADYPIVLADHRKLFNVDTTSGNITLTLPDSATVQDGFEVIVKHNGGGNNVIIARAGTDTIDGGTSETIFSENVALRIINNGSGEYQIVSQFNPVAGDVSGPGSSTDNNFAVFNGTTGKIIKDASKAIPTGDVVGTTDTQTMSGKTLTSPVLNTSISGTAFLDEDDMASNSAIKVASQQSIKTYTDRAVVGGDYDEMWKLGGQDVRGSSAMTLAKGGAMFTGQTSGSNGYAYWELPAAPGDSNYGLDWDQIDTIELEWRSQVPATPSNYIVGLASSSAALTSNTSLNSKVIIDFNLSSQLTFRSADLGSEETNTVSVTTSFMHTYKIVVKMGVDAKLYVDGVLEATNSTNIPPSTNANCRVGFGNSTNSKLLTTTQFTARIKYA